MVTFDAINPFCTQNYLQMWSLLQVVLICSVFVSLEIQVISSLILLFCRGKMKQGDHAMSPLLLL